MKNIINVLMISLALLLGAVQLRQLVVKPTPQMHCEKCENKIKKQLSYERGVRKVDTSLDKQTITITYDGSKTNKEKLQKSLSDIGYTTQVVKDEAVQQKKKK